MRRYMGHCIQIFIGEINILEKIASNWDAANMIPLKQQFAMIFLTNQFFDVIEEMANTKDTLNDDRFLLLTSAIQEQILQPYSKNGMLAYLETDYFGGVGTQAGVLFENGERIEGPSDKEGIINQILRKMGVCIEPGKDEFDSVGLGNYRHMPLE